MELLHQWQTAGAQHVAEFASLTVHLLGLKTVFTLSCLEDRYLEPCAVDFNYLSEQKQSPKEVLRL